MNQIDTHLKVMTYGRHKGQLFTRLPISYLKWLIGKQAPDWEVAQAELERRGTTTLYDMEISGHAIDRASEPVVFKLFQATKLKNEGLHAWLYRMATDARKKGEENSPNKYHYKKLKFVFEDNDYYPTLKTVIPNV